MKRMNLEEIRQKALDNLKKIKDSASLEVWRIKYLGRKSQLNQFLRSLVNLSLEEKRDLGAKANNLRRQLGNLFQEKLTKLNVKGQLSKVAVDLTQPGRKIARGHFHPLTLVENEVKEIFCGLNFSVVEGPELETEYYNFDALNIPKDHPARDMWDTLWLQSSQKIPNPKSQIPNRLLMRTHTSPVQIRYMEKHQPPFQIIVPGRVFRHEATDASHEINFHQVEGLMVGKNVSLANFKFVVTEFFKKFFKKPIEFRFRPSYFPFTEPSIEVDIKMESGRWLEMMGAGMIHPKISSVPGFAFGAGIERLAMIKYKIPDIRLFYSSDLRFIRQF